MVKTNDYIIEKPSKEILPPKVNAKSQRGIILSLLTIIRNNAKAGITYTNAELIIMLEEGLRRYDELKKSNERENVLYALVGWKGQDFPTIFNDGEEFVLQEHRKNKFGEIEMLTHKVSYKSVEHILKYIKSFPVKETKNCYDVAKYLGYGEWKDLWKERKVYFETYYFPVKVLESMGIIFYSSKGRITRLK